MKVKLKLKNSLTLVKSSLPLILVLIFSLNACGPSLSKIPPSALFASGFESHSPTMGNPDAPVKVYMFSDFACENCYQSSNNAKQLIQEYPKDVQVIFKHLPSRAGAGSLNAAKAARAAAAQNRFWDMHDILFQFSRTRSKPELRGIADLLSLDLEQFKNDFSDPKQEIAIKKDISLAQKWGVRGTPAFFINGQVIHNAKSLGKISELIDRELRLSSRGYFKKTTR